MTNVLYAWLAVLDFANDPEPFPCSGEQTCHAAELPLRHNQDHADSHVEGAEQVRLRHISQCADQIENRQNWPTPQPDYRTRGRREYARGVVGDSAAGDMNQSLEEVLGE
jgi:hypothetical protein